MAHEITDALPTTRTPTLTLTPTLTPTRHPPMPTSRLHSSTPAAHGSRRAPHGVVHEARAGNSRPSAGGPRASGTYTPMPWRLRPVCGRVRGRISNLVPHTSFLTLLTYRRVFLFVTAGQASAFPPHPSSLVNTTLRGHVIRKEETACRCPIARQPLRRPSTSASCSTATRLVRPSSRRRLVTGLTTWSCRPRTSTRWRASQRWLGRRSLQTGDGS